MQLYFESYGLLPQRANRGQLNAGQWPLLSRVSWNEDPCVMTVTQGAARLRIRFWLAATGDEVGLDTGGRRQTHLLLSAYEIDRRLEARPEVAPYYGRRNGTFLQHVNPADEGYDFDFLRLQ